MRVIRLSVPDARTAAVRARIAEQLAAFDRAEEEAAMRWVESVLEFDDDAAR